MAENGNRAAKGEPESEKDYLAKIAATGPTWARVAALVVLLAGACSPIVEHVSDYLEQREVTILFQDTMHVSTDPGVYTGGTPIAAPSHATEPVAALGPADANHLVWHAATLEERPPFKRILVGEKKAILAYSVYPSDGCVLVKHMNRGHIKTDLVRAEEQAKGALANDSNIPFFKIPPGKLNVDWEVHTGGASLNEEKTPMQGSCINPHPGQFKYWVGPSSDPCWAPFFRQFADGCTHYQMWNRCNNTWNPQVIWTFCQMNHSW